MPCFPAAPRAIHPPMHGVQAWRPRPRPLCPALHSSVGSAWLHPRSSGFPSGLRSTAHVPEAAEGSLAAGSQQETVLGAGLLVTSDHWCGAGLCDGAFGEAAANPRSL